jgi:riboflavin synthase alpha subunit
MVGKKFTCSPVLRVTWIVEVISETLTHVYVRNLKSGRRWNIPKSVFKADWKEIV